MLKSIKININIANCVKVHFSKKNYLIFVSIVAFRVFTTNVRNLPAKTSLCQFYKMKKTIALGNFSQIPQHYSDSFHDKKSRM